MRIWTTHPGTGQKVAVIALVFLLCTLAAPAARSQGVAQGTRIDLTAKLNLNTGQFAQLFVPDFYWPTVDDRFTLVFHLHSASWAAEDQVYRSNTNAILVNIHLGALSSPYQNYFTNHANFQRILDTTIAVLRSNNIIAQPVINKLIVTSFSAGYAGVREIFKSYYNRIDALTLADGLHSNSDSSTMRTQMQDFLRFARDAAARRKVFLLTHSSIPTSGYASTTATANYLIQNTGITRIPHSAVDEIGTQYSRADTGHFRLKGYLGETASDHLRHLHNMHLMLARAVRLLDSTTASVDDVQTKPEGFHLYQNYPNPFNPETTIQFSTGTNAVVSLRIFDLLGREVATLHNGFMPAGTHSVHWRPEGLASGSYLYRLQAGGHTITRRFVFLK